ncbi:uncharacterized protein LOC141661028 [Apium graveolens]|uniref:uncharacterized protein LOC141661028 n=1 Tax=Apium graveolens TaxID=4045 RepID=UPI003D7A49B9
MSWIVNGDYNHDFPSEEACCCPDSMQKKCTKDWSSFPPEELDLIKGIIENDEAAKFKSFLEKLEINYVRGDVFLILAGCKVCPYNIFGKICHYCAYNCAIELFSHKVGSMMNLNIKNCHGSYPLHDAAITLSSSLVKESLEHGATPETRAWDPVPSRKISSLDYALEILSCDRNLINWNPKKSVFKLIITLCLPQMKEARETIALLAGFATTIDILDDAIFNAVKRGQVVPVAALLLVARKKVLRDLYFFGDNVSSSPLTFPRAIMNELAAVINQEYALLGREEHAEILQLCLEKKELMLYFLQMLEIFEKAGPELDLYLKSCPDKTTCT